MSGAGNTWVATALALVLGWAAGSCAEAGEAVGTVAVSSELLRLPPAQREAQVQARFAATPLIWPGGKVVLADAIARLAAGNPTTLGAGVDPKEVAELNALMGDYWQGVVALCEAFDLVLEPGEGMDQSEDSGRYGNRDNSGTALVAQGGPLVLLKRDPARPRPLYTACGPLLVEVSALDLRQRRGIRSERRLEAQLQLRFEPRVTPTHVGTTLVAWSGVEDAAGRRLDWSESGSPGRAADGATLILAQVPERLAGFQIGGELLVQALEPVSLTATLRPGAKARTDLLGQEVAMQLLAEGDTTANGQRGPGLSVGLPTAVLGTRPRVQVTSNGQPVQFNNQGSQWSGARIELFYRSPKLGDAECAVTLGGQAALQQLRLPLKITVGLDRLPTAEAVPAAGLDLQLPTRLSWPASHLPLHQAIRLLGGANQVLLELGADERRQGDLPAFSGSFWEGALVVCRAFDLAILPPAQTVGADPEGADDDGQQGASAAYVTGGPLCLGARRADRRGADSFQACGILLMGIDDVAVVVNQGLTGVARQADIAYRLRLEPRFDASLIGSAAVVWTSLAGLADGRPLLVEDLAAPVDEHRSEQRVRFVRVGRRVVRVPDQDDAAATPSSSGTVSVSGLPAGPVKLDLSGQVSLVLRRPTRAELMLTPGGRGIAHLGGRTLVVKLFTNGGEDTNGYRSGVSVDLGADPLETLRVDVRGPTGKALRGNGNSSNGNNGRTRSLWYFQDIDQGQYTVQLAARERLATVRLPFMLSTVTP
jgi:hypothetical protein